jgi:HEAT repeat protein
MRDDDNEDEAIAALDALASDSDWELPPESRAVLEESLRSPDPAVRREAVEMLAQSIDDGLATLALEIARRDPEEEIRAAAASALAPALAASADPSDSARYPPLSERGVEAVRQGLRQLYFDSASPKELRRRALEAAVQAPETWQVGAVRSAWASDDPEWRASAVFCMVRLPDFVSELQDALRDRAPIVRLEAARAAGDAGLVQAASRLLVLAQAADEEPLVRIAAMESIGLLGDRKAMSALRELAATPDPELSFAARSALARIKGYEEDEEGAES